VLGLLLCLAAALLSVPAVMGWRARRAERWRRRRRGLSSADAALWIFNRRGRG